MSSFNIFAALCDHPELLFEIAGQLDIEDLVSLYAISKDFHYTVDMRFTTLIHSQCLTRAQESARVFHFKAYKPLCILDPASRRVESDPRRVRMVPSFRWLRMVLFREKVIDDGFQCMAADGHMPPLGSKYTVKLLWLLMDVPTNAKRVGFIRNTKYWTDEDLFIATMFFVKLDMMFTDPVDGEGATALRKLLVDQNSFQPLLQCLQQKMTHFDLVQLHVQTARMPVTNDPDQRIFGIERRRVGSKMREGESAKGNLVLRLDQLIMREEIRRNLNLQDYYESMLLWGYIEMTST
jgi:hypothetical protein